jgi:hypothetical protein
MAIGNDGIHSLEGAGSSSIIVYDDEYYTGRCEEFNTAGDGDLTNNWIGGGEITSFWINMSGQPQKTCDHGPDATVEWCNQPQVAAGDFCTHNIRNDFEAPGKWVAGGQVVNNCNPGVTTSASQTISDMVAVGTSVTNSRDDSFSWSASFATPWWLSSQFGGSTSTGKSFTRTETSTSVHSMVVTAPPGKVTRLQFRPKMWVTEGWVHADFNGNSIEGMGVPIHDAFDYPAKDSSDLRVELPIVDSAGLPVGEWKPRYDACKYRVQGKQSLEMLDVVDSYAQIAFSTGSSRQDWIFQPKNDTGTAFEVINAQSGKCLDIVEASREDGARVQEYGCHGGSNQSWRLVKSGSSIQIQSNMHGKCLEVFGGFKTAGSKVTMWSCLGGDNQKWNFTEVDQ